MVERVGRRNPTSTEEEEAGFEGGNEGGALTATPPLLLSAGRGEGPCFGDQRTPPSPFAPLLCCEPSSCIMLLVMLLILMPMRTPTEAGTIPPAALVGSSPALLLERTASSLPMITVLYLVACGRVEEGPPERDSAMPDAAADSSSATLT